MSIRLYSTLSRKLEELPPPPGPDPHVLLRADRLPAHPRRQRAAVRHLACGCAPGSGSAGYEVKLVENITDINDKIYDAAPGASAELAAQATAWYIEDTDLLGLGRPDVEPKATESIPAIVAAIEELVARDFAYEVEGDVYFRVARYPRLRRAVAAAARPGRGAGAEPAQGGPARLRALEGEQAGRGHVVGVALGPRPARLAHRVLGDGRGAPRARCSRSTAAGSTSSSRITRTSSPSRARSATSSRSIWMHNGMLEFVGEKMSKSLGNVVSLRDAIETWGRETMLALPHDRALAIADRLLRRDAGGGAGAGGDVPERVRRAAGAGRGRRGSEFAARARGRLQHGGRAGGAARLARGRGAGLRAARARRCSGSGRWRRWLTAPARGASRWRSARQAARAGGDFAEADRLRGEIDARRVGGARLARAASGSSRDDAPSSSTGGARFAKRCAAGARCSSCSPPSGRRARTGSASRRSSPRRALTELAGTRDHQGVVARVEPYPLRGRVGAGRRRAAARLPRPGDRSAQPRRRDPQRGRARGRRASCFRRTTRRG